MSDQEGDKVIQLDNKISITPKRHIKYNCSHIKITLDEGRRNIVCDSCGTVIEPFDFLWKYANNQQRIVWEIKSAKHEVARLESKVGELKRQKRNL